MKKEISPVAIGLVAVVCLLILGFVAWKVFGQAPVPSAPAGVSAKKSTNDAD